MKLVSLFVILSYLYKKNYKIFYKQHVLYLMFSVKKGTIYLDCNSKINNSSISNSSISMNGNIITLHGMPVVSSDVANKQYVDSLFSANFLTNTLFLVSTNWTPINPPILSGQLRVSVKNSILNGPSASFDLTKSTNSTGASITRSSSLAGTNTHERLEIRWLPNTTIEMRKTGVGYNGSYNIKIYLNE